jgi:hypothetical protein
LVAINSAINTSTPLQIAGEGVSPPLPPANTAFSFAHTTMLKRTPPDQI